jgi:hypothetical protein
MDLPKQRVRIVDPLERNVVEHVRDLLVDVGVVIGPHFVHELSRIVHRLERAMIRDRHLLKRGVLRDRLVLVIGVEVRFDQDHDVSKYRWQNSNHCRGRTVIAGGGSVVDLLGSELDDDGQADQGEDGDDDLLHGGSP